MEAAGNFVSLAVRPPQTLNAKNIPLTPIEQNGMLISKSP